MAKRKETYDIGIKDPLAFIILDQKSANTDRQTQFVTEPRELFCYVFSDSQALTSFQQTLWKYFCDVSSTKTIDGFVFFGYNCILALRVCRYLKVTFR